MNVSRRKGWINERCCSVSASQYNVKPALTCWKFGVQSKLSCCANIRKLLRVSTGSHTELQCKAHSSHSCYTNTAVVLIFNLKKANLSPKSVARTKSTIVTNIHEKANMLLPTISLAVRSLLGWVLWKISLLHSLKETFLFGLWSCREGLNFAASIVNRPQPTLG